MADALASLTCYKGVLPQGAPTSPYLANLVLRDMDKKLMELCGKEEITYTRYADDMSFSSNKDIMVYWDALKRIVEQFHFRINENKTVYYQEPHRKIVTGLIGLAFQRLIKDDCGKKYIIVENMGYCSIWRTQGMRKEQRLKSIYMVKLITFIWQNQKRGKNFWQNWIK